MTKLKLILKKLFFFTLISSFLAASIQTPVLADMISTEELVSATDVDMKRDEIRDILQQNDVRNFMIENGVSPDNADQRLNNLTDAEVMAMHQQLDDLTTGQGALGTIAVVLLILILLDVAGVTDIFPGI